MPNWCCGTLKVRGMKENVINFLTKGLIAVDYIGNDVKESKFYIDEYEDINYIPSKSLSCFWIEGTRRGFVYPKEYYFNYYNKEKNEVIVCLDTKFAWTIHVEQLLEISKKYDIDLKIYAFEGGMEFNLDIEVSKGKVIKSEVIEFDNYAWECTNPMIGG